MRLILFSVLIKMGSHQNGSQEEHQNHHYEKYHKRVRISQNSLLFYANISRSKTLNAIHDSDLTARLLAVRSESRIACCFCTQYAYGCVCCLLDAKKHRLNQAAIFLCHNLWPNLTHT